MTDLNDPRPTIAERAHARAHNLAAILGHRPAPTAPEIRDAEVLAAIETKLAAARITGCGHDITAPTCDFCTPSDITLRTELAATLVELQLAVAHDRQPYPTAEAYTAACAAIGRHSDRADRAEEDARRLGAQYTEAMSGAGHLADKLTRVRAMIATVREEYTRFGKEAERTVALSVTDDVLEVLDAQVVHPGTEQPVSGPQQVDQPAAHGGQVVHAVPIDWSGAGGIFASLIRKYPNAYPENTTKEN